MIGQMMPQTIITTTEGLFPLDTFPRLSTSGWCGIDSIPR